MESVGVLVDNRLKAHEEKVFAEIRAIQVRTSALESKAASCTETGGVSVQGNASKRACSAPGSSNLSTLSFCTVITGFPSRSRRKDIETYMRQRMAEHEEWSSYEPFAPNIRGSVALIKMKSMGAVYRFVR